MKKSRLLGAVCACVFTFITSVVNAASIGITGYDIQNASVSGTGGWQHFYIGVRTATSGNQANYSGGTGTLADGVIGSTHTNSQLFCNLNCDESMPDDTNQIITLYLDGFYKISEIDIYGGAINSHASGQIDGMDVTINGITQTFSTIGFGPPGLGGAQLINDRITTTGSTLDNLITNQIVLSSITATEVDITTIEFDTFPVSTFSITEVQIFGTSVVPIPPALWLFASGLLGLVGMAKRKSAH